MDKILSAELAVKVIRHLLQLAGGALVAKGMINETVLDQAIGAVMTLGTFGYMIWTNSKAKSVTPA